jgi:hypothetical protein
VLGDEVEHILPEQLLPAEAVFLGGPVHGRHIPFKVEDNDDIPGVLE